MADTIRTIAYLLASLFQDGQAEGAITEQDARDMIVTLAPPETTLTPAGAAVAWNLSTDPAAVVSLTDGSTTITASNGEAGRTYDLVVTQGTGGNAVVLSGVTVLGTPNWRTVAGQFNIVSVRVSGTTRIAVVV